MKYDFDDLEIIVSPIVAQWSCCVETNRQAERDRLMERERERENERDRSGKYK